MAHEDEIRLIAYSIWESEGCPNGRDCDHWYRAEIVWQEQQKPEVAAKPAAALKTKTKRPASRQVDKKKMAAAANQANG